MRKYITIVLSALMIFSATSCKKSADVLGTEAKLPKLQLSSLGYQQSSPFAAATTVLAINFGATTTGATTGKFTLDIYTGTSASGTPLKTVTFPAWSGKDATSTATTTVHSISYITQPTSYPNTTVYSGTILLKLSALGLAPATFYSVKATAYNADGTVTSAYSQTSFFKTI
jgi:hypothetical protein